MRNRFQSYVRAIVFIYYGLSCFANPISAQINVPQFYSPQTQSLLKFSQIPVSKYTGIPQITIPLFTLKTPLKPVNISLDYHASGIKDTDMPTWVGLGWTLRAGGTITRIIKGYPDEYINNPTLSSTILHSKLKDARVHGFEETLADYKFDIINSSSMLKCLDSELPAYSDTQIDMYNYDVNGISGQFTFDNEGNILKLTADNNKIEYLEDKTFRITDGDGIVYCFKDTEEDFVTVGNSQLPYTNSWYLSLAKNPITQDSITFNYNKYTSGQASSISFNRYEYFDRMKIFDDSYTISPAILAAEPSVWQKICLSDFLLHTGGSQNPLATCLYLKTINHNYCCCVYF